MKGGTGLGRRDLGDLRGEEREGGAEDAEDAEDAEGGGALFEGGVTGDF